MIETILFITFAPAAVMVLLGVANRDTADGIKLAFAWCVFALTGFMLVLGYRVLELIF